MGSLGVVAGLEVVRSCGKQDYTTIPITIMNFTNEEGAALSRPSCHRVYLRVVLISRSSCKSTDGEGITSDKLSNRVGMNGKDRIPLKRSVRLFRIAYRTGTNP